MNWDQLLNSEALAWAIAAIAICSATAIGSWAVERRKEREAFYRSEAIKKIAEMQGAVSEPVLQVLREALRPKPESPWAAVAVRATHARDQSETIQRIAETQGSDAALEYMREDRRKAERRQREGIKLGGMITSGVGVGLFVFLRALVPDEPVYLVGTIPFLVGAALLIYGYFMAPQE
jgi:hypothetical protein